MRFVLLQREFRVSNPQNDRGGSYHWCFRPVGNDSTGDFSAPLRCARNDRGGRIPLCFLPAGNYWRIVSYGSETQWCFLSTGNYSYKVSYWSDTQWYFLPTGNYSRRVSYGSDTHWYFLSTGNLINTKNPLHCGEDFLLYFTDYRPNLAKISSTCFSMGL